MALPASASESTALITGASAGIGVELARALARRGHGVTLVARRTERLDQLASELGSRHGVRAEALSCDLSLESERDRLAGTLEERGLTVEILCNNAGFGNASRFIRLERERELSMLRVNCEAVIDLCSRYAPPMVDRGRGAILNVASTAAFQPIPGQSTYAATKALVLSFTEALHQELAGSSVAVTVLCPGPVRTEFAAVAGMRDIDATTPDFVWTPASRVAEDAIRGLEAGDRVVIPGAIHGLGALLGRLVPRGMWLRVADRFYPVGRE
jgi:short-subunit dehydrogenase